MLTGKVMVAYDGSTYSKVVLEWALALQERLGVTVDVVTVLPPIGNLFMYADYPRYDERKGKPERRHGKIHGTCCLRNAPIKGGKWKRTS